MENIITINLAIQTDGAVKSEITSTRPVHASNIFNNKSIDETLKMIPLLFSVCSTAQSTAAVVCCEQALELDTKPQHKLIRQRLVEMESIREHLWRILLDWNEFIVGTPDKTNMSNILSFQQYHKQAITGGASPFQINPTFFKIDHKKIIEIQQQLKQTLKLKLFGIDTEEWLKIDTIEQFDKWLRQGQTITTKMLQKIQESGWNSSGSCRINPLPKQLEQIELEMQLTNPEYVEQPLWKQHPCETSALTRTTSKLIQKLKKEYGNGLLVRQIAKLTELAHLVLKVDQLEYSKEDCDESEHITPNTGIAQVEAARGRLIHKVKIQGDRVEQYQILAPTEWNFHHDGVVARALNSLNKNSTDLQNEAELIIKAIDPCVDYKLNWIT